MSLTLRDKLVTFNSLSRDHTHSLVPPRF